MENVYWIQTVVVKCIIITLADALASTCTQIEFLKSLISMEFEKKLIGKCYTIGTLPRWDNLHFFIYFFFNAVRTPNLESLLEYTKILSDTTVQLNFSYFDATANIDESEAEIEKCINELVALEDYDNALKLSNVAALNASNIILAQVSTNSLKKF